MCFGKMLIFVPSEKVSCAVSPVPVICSALLDSGVRQGEVRCERKTNWAPPSIYFFCALVTARAMGMVAAVLLLPPLLPLARAVDDRLSGSVVV